MPNWVYNTLRISGTPCRIAEIKDKAYFNGLVFNFRAFVPVDYNDPDYQNHAEKHPDASPIANHENFNLEDWMIDHWGTSNAVDSKIAVDEPDSTSYTFNTAWEPPVKFVKALEKLYPDVNFSLEYVREIDDEGCVDDYMEDDEPEESNQEEKGQEEVASEESHIISANNDFDFMEWLESGERDHFLSKRVEFLNTITMDHENIEKFKKLYGYDRQDGKRTFFDTLFSFSRIIPEPIRDDADKNWVDNSERDIWTFWRSKEGAENETPEPLVGRELEIWRYDNWGTPSEAMYDSNEEPFGCDLWGYVLKEDSVIPPPLDGLLKGEYGFYTLCKPPIEIYKKMAMDGLVFKVSWHSDSQDEWVIGDGLVEEGTFQYHKGPMTGEEREQLNLVAHSIFLDPEDGPDYHPTIFVKNREHLDQLIRQLQDYLKNRLDLFGTFGLIKNVEGNTIALNCLLDLNFFSISSDVTDLSNLFADFDVSPCPEKGWFCKIKLDISRWDVSNVTKMANLFNSERVDLGDLSRWNTSKVID